LASTFYAAHRRGQGASRPVQDPDLDSLCLRNLLRGYHWLGLMRQSCMTSRSASRQIGAWHSWPERELRPFRPLLQHRRLDGKPPVLGLLERDTRSGSRSSVHCSADGHHFSCVMKPAAGCFRSGSAHLRVKNGLACEHPLRASPPMAPTVQTAKRGTVWPTGALVEKARSKTSV